MQVNWDTLNRQEWESVLTERGGSLQQSWAYGEAMRSLGVGVFRAAVYSPRGQLLCLGQLTARRILAYLVVATCSRGPIWTEEGLALDPMSRAAALKGMQKALPASGWKAVLISPNDPGPTDPALHRFHRVMTGYSTVMVNLSNDEEALRRALQGNWRNRLVKAERALAGASQGPSRWSLHLNASMGPTRTVLKQEGLQRSARGFSGLPLGFIEQFIGAHKDANRAFLLARVDVGSELAAGLIFLLHGSRATYHIGWGNDLSRQNNLHTLLMWRAMLELKRRGIRLLDLGGVNTESLAGITRFKLGTGGEPICLPGTYI